MDPHIIGVKFYLHSYAPSLLIASNNTSWVSHLPQPVTGVTAISAPSLTEVSNIYVSAISTNEKLELITHTIKCDGQVLVYDPYCPALRAHVHVMNANNGTIAAKMLSYLLPGLDD